MLCGQSPSNRVTNRRAAKAPASTSVFINCPFDEGFKGIFRAIVFTVISSGYHPRCALDSTDSAEIRISKIAKLIGECDWGIHDLSRIEIDPVVGVPRFNMSLELGLHLGARLFYAGQFDLSAELHVRDELSLRDLRGDLISQGRGRIRVM